MVWLFGCSSTTCSVLDPEKRVNRQELEAELNYITELVNSRIEDINRQDEIKREIVAAFANLEAGGQFNPLGLLSLGGTVAAIGFGLDRNYKKKRAEKILKQVENGENSKLS